MFFPIVPKKKSPAAPNVGATAPSSMLKRAMSWITDGLGLPSNDVPSNLTNDTIQPVVEMYRPRLRQIVTPVEAAAGSGQWDFICPQGVYWEFVSLGFRLTTSANAGNREVVASVFFVVGGAVISAGLIHSAGGNKVQATGLTFFYSVGAHGVVGDTQVTPGRVLIPFPSGLIIPPGVFIRVQDINGVDPALDSFTIWCLVVKEHPGVQVN